MTARLEIRSLWRSCEGERNVVGHAVEESFVQIVDSSRCGEGERGREPDAVESG